LADYKDEPIVGQWQNYSDDDTEGFVYGYDLEDYHNRETQALIDEANAKLSDGEVLDLIYDFCEAQVLSHPILEDIIKILKENE